MHQQPRTLRTWDGAPSRRTWDIWTHSYLILGLLETHRYFPAERYLAAARRIGDLCWETLSGRGGDITELGNHHGMSATVLMDPAVELYLATQDEKCLNLAKLVLQQANDRPELQLLSQALAGVDAADIATGKAYQLCWNLVGLAKLGRVTGDSRFLNAASLVWESIRKHHLTLGGGPWGGVAHRSREVFNHHSVFSPTGYVETCSVLAWIQLSRELLRVTGEAQYAEEIERSAYNDLLGAQAADGENWCYYSFPNGKRIHTTYWRCCKSSGAIALEELPAIAYSAVGNDGIAINLYGPSRARITTSAAGNVTLEQLTQYPFDGHIRITVSPERTALFSILVRVPSYAAGASIAVNGVESALHGVPGTFVALKRNWQAGDEITLRLPMTPIMHRRSTTSVQESKAPDGEQINQEVLHYDYVAITRGPLVYATGLIDGFKSHETLRIAASEQSSLEVVGGTADDRGPTIRWHLGYRAPLAFVPYYEAGGRHDGAWRLTWMQVVPRDAA
jgi:DUF1680 family protein